MRLFILFIGSCFLAACQSTNTQGVSFVDPGFRGPVFRSLVVEGQGDLLERRALELAAVDALRSQGLLVTPALEIISPTENISDKERQRRAVKTGAQGVLSIIPVKREVVSSRSYAGGPYYGGGVYSGGGRHGTFGGVGVGFPIGSPYEDTRDLRAAEVVYEATLYALPDFKVVWRGDFKSRGPVGIASESIARNVARQVAARLKADGVI